MTKRYQYELSVDYGDGIPRRRESINQPQNKIETDVAFIAIKRHNKSMSKRYANRIDPEGFTPSEKAALENLVKNGARPVLLTKSGELVELPNTFSELLLTVANAVKRAAPIFLVTESMALTTQEGAHFLGISRQYLVHILETGALPFHRVGTHRRIYYSDLLQYQNEQSNKRHAILNQMTDDLVEAGVYDRPLPHDQDESCP